MTDLNDVAAWFQTAKPGDKIVYHTGNLAYDCHIFPSTPPQTIEQKRSIRAAARFLMARSDANEVRLVQRRVKEGVCDYIAVKTA